MRSAEVASKINPRVQCKSADAGSAIGLRENLKIAALSTGQLDANSQTWSDTLGPLAKGLPLKAVLVNDNSAGNDAVMVGPKIQSFADLRGHTIALEQYSVSHFVLYTALARNGLTPKDVKVVNLAAGDAAAAGRPLLLPERWGGRGTGCRRLGGAGRARAQAG